MKMRPPAVPLIAADPYFSIWSMEDLLPGNDTYHWTGTPHRLTGRLIVDGEVYVFMGKAEGKLMEQVSMQMDLFSTTYQFRCPQARLTVRFTSPQVPERTDVLCRPVAYAEFSLEKTADAQECSLCLTACDEVCLDKRFDSPTVFSQGSSGDLHWFTLENSEQEPLCRCGDDIRIQWGKFYLAVQTPQAKCAAVQERRVCEVSNTGEIVVPIEDRVLAAYAYDDFQSLMYFGTPLLPWWRKYDETMEALLERAFREHDEVMALCCSQNEEILAKAREIGGEVYKELLILAWRQAMAAHKAAIGPEGELLYVSKECFSDGDAATVDVTYPSSPLYLLYNPELLRGMLQPIFTLASGADWVWDCAPHDMGIYPLLNGQEYKDKDGTLVHMPVEECGNMIILTCAYVKASGDREFGRKYLPLLKKWVRYLEENGEDPADQLCTDDFAGRSPHNCNLTLKAIMGVACYGMICGLLDDIGQEQSYLAKAKAMAKSWLHRAQKEDGSYRRAFDLPDSFSLKYNMVWDKVFGTDLFDSAAVERELRSYLPRANAYGVPLDERADYTKCDWIVWCAAMTQDREVFDALVQPVWQAYNDMPIRYPMGDWYSSVTGQLHRYPDLYTRRMISFQNRSVVAGIAMPLLVQSRKLQG